MINGLDSTHIPLDRAVDAAAVVRVTAEADATARLIADLLAACKQADYAFRVPAGTRVDDELKALDMLRVVIDRAEGR